jgi:hypothetical protein
MQSPSTPKESLMSRTVYVGVDLLTEQVTIVARNADMIRDAYVLRGEYSGDHDGVIYLADDGTYNGRAALDIALADGPVGLGWTFKPRLPAVWSR